MSTTTVNKVKKGEASLSSLFSEFLDSDNIFNQDTFKSLEKNIPSVNISENTKELKVDIAVPGLTKNELHVHIENHILVIAAEKKKEQTSAKDDYVHQEYNYSSFIRSFTLPDIVLEDKISAKYQDGILHIILPKSKVAVQHKSKKISIN